MSDIDLYTEPHVDDFIDDSLGYSSESERYARWIFNHWRLPAHLRADFDPFMKDYKLFCKYKGSKYRVIGCSRLGDVWLTKHFERDHGYDKRVPYDQCSDWSKD